MPPRIDVYDKKKRAPGQGVQGAIAAQSYLEAQKKELAQGPGLGPGLGSASGPGLGLAQGSGLGLIPGLGPSGVVADPSLQLTPFFDDRWGLPLVTTLLTPLPPRHRHSLSCNNFQLFGVLSVSLHCITLTTDS